MIDDGQVRGSKSKIALPDRTSDCNRNRTLFRRATKAAFGYRTTSEHGSPTSFSLSQYSFMDMQDIPVSHNSDMIIFSLTGPLVISSTQCVHVWPIAVPLPHFFLSQDRTSIHKVFKPATHWPYLAWSVGNCVNICQHICLGTLTHLAELPLSLNDEQLLSSVLI